MERRLILLGGLIALALISTLCVVRSLDAIPADIEARALARFEDENMRWVRVNVRGRDLQMSGLAADTAASARAAEVAATLAGVRRISNRLAVIRDDGTGAATAGTGAGGITPKPEPTAAPVPGPTQAAELTLERMPDRITLAGVVPAEESRRKFGAEALDRFGTSAVINSLAVRQDMPAGWMEAANVGLALLRDLERGRVVIREGSISVEGIASAPAGVARIENRLADALPAGYRGVADVSATQDLQAVLREAPSLARRLSERERGSAAPPAVRPAVPSPEPDGAPVAVATTSPQTPAPSEPELQPRATSPAAAACQREMNELLTRRTIRFETASDVIDQNSLSLLDELVAIAGRCPDNRIEIAGHTDDQGTRANNLRLSQRRAEAVMTYLVSRGLGLNRMTARGYGEERPLVPNRTADDRAVNRRIEFKIIEER